MILMMTVVMARTRNRTARSAPVGPMSSRVETCVVWRRVGSAMGRMTAQMDRMKPNVVGLDIESQHPLALTIVIIIIITIIKVYFNSEAGSTELQNV